MMTETDGIMGQLSIFAALGYETPEIDAKDCRKDVKAWVIEFCGITNSFDDEAPILYYRARPRRIVFERDSKLESRGGCVYWHTDDSLDFIGSFGMYWEPGKFFASKPSWTDCERCVRENPDFAGQEIRVWERRMSVWDGA